MIEGLSVLGLIPARGGSKRVKRKNVRPFAGAPMISWTIRAGQASKFIDEICLTSEDDEIIDVARNYGCNVPFKRPTELATDKASSMDAVIHALDNIKEKFDLLVLLQPTSPLRTSSDIDACIEKCVYNNIPSCISVSALDKPESFFGRILSGGEFSNQAVFAASQGQPCYLNGAVYVARTDLILNQKTFYTPQTLAHVMSAENSLDVDEEHEFIMAEALMKARIRSREADGGNR